MRFIKQVQVTLIVMAQLVGRLVAGILATYVGILTISLFSAYAFDSSNYTGISYYVGGAFWKLFTIPFGLLDHYWGIPLVVAQFLLLFLFILRNPLQLKWLLALSVLMICIGYDFTYWNKPKSIADFVCSLVVVCGLYWIARWVTQKYKSKGAAKTPVPPNTNTPAILLMTLLITGLGYLYSEYYYPHFHVSEPEVLGDSTRARKLAHKVISHNLGDHHDAFLTLGSVGTEESIPFLINALRWQEITTAESHGMVCTKGHCLDVLIHLTGQNPGHNYPEWKQWWDTNKAKSRRMWAMEALEKAGFQVADPPDDIFIQTMIARIDTLKWNALNAYCLLKEIPQGRCLAAIDKAAQSPDPSERKGAIWCLWQLQFPDAALKISPFLKDNDAEVRKLAETAIKSMEFEKTQKTPSPK